MKQLLLPSASSLILGIMLICAGLNVHAEETVNWEYDDNNLNSFIIDGDVSPQLVGDFWLTDQYDDTLVFSSDIECQKFYNLRLAIGVIGEESATNVQVSDFQIMEATGEYHDTIAVQATISADNYDPVLVQRTFYLEAEECSLEKTSKPILLARDRTNIESAVQLATELGEPLQLNSVDTGNIEPGPAHICDVIVPCIFGSDPPVFTEANQPPQTRFNAITDNPTIGNETTNSVWVTDESGNLINSLAADHTYTAHFYARVSGPEAATNTTIKSHVIDEEILWGGGSRDIITRLVADNAKKFDYAIDYPVQTDIRLHYVEGSLTLHCANQTDIALDPNQFFVDPFYTGGDGVQIGTNGLDGTITPGLDSACEITYQFSTTDYGAEQAAEKAEKEAKKAAKKAAEEEAEAKEALTFSERCSVWLTDEKGNEVDYLTADKTYTVHASVRINGEGQAEGVKVNSSNLSSLVLDEHSQSLYFKLTADNLEENTIGKSISRFRDTGEVITLDFVKNSLQMKSATGTYNLSNKDLFNYETGCLIGFNGPDGIVPAGDEYAVEIIYQIKTSSNSPKETTSADIFRHPAFTVSLLIICILEFICIIFMAFCPNNRLARFISRCRRFAKSVKNSISMARADFRNDTELVPASVDTEVKDGAKTETKAEAATESEPGK